MHLNLMWFRSDLRVHDNPALSAACKAGPCLAVYCLTPEQCRRHDVSVWKQDLILRHLRVLAADLSALNIPLVVLDCGDFSRVPDALVRFARAHAVHAVFCNAEYELNEARCAANVRRSVQANAMSWHESHDQCALAPGRVLTQSGEMFKVFTAFKRAYFKAFEREARTLHRCPSAQGQTGVDTDLRAVDALRLNLPGTAWPAGESVAQAQLQDFLDHGIELYDRQRDFPALDATSVLSPYLAIGALSTTQCLHAALSVNQGRLDGGNAGVACWISELVWRDFYRHLLAAFPDLSRHQPFQIQTDRLPWRRDEKLFAAWCEGRTGYPLVDAAMRQLNTTGWMHNRLRMVTAMFLTKHLFIDWRMGERYFMQHLVDGDLASNNGGWQWSASTGVDAVPYFRIFNPTRQSERFDAQGDFIRRFVPELVTLDSRSIHQPSTQQALDCGYPLPIIQHAPAVADTKRWFQALSANAGPSE